MLLDEDGRSIGSAPKASVHHRETPLHLGFSCYVFDSDGRFLLTRRAAHKKTWPGVWTNSFCGHPSPGEDIASAVRRRGQTELGLDIPELTLALPAFRYRAVMPDGTAENEMCPVFLSTVTAPVRAEPDETDAVAWVDWATFRVQVLAGERDISPWCAAQVAQLPPTGQDPGADWGALPPALGTRR